MTEADDYDALARIFNRPELTTADLLSALLHDVRADLGNAWPDRDASYWFADCCDRFALLAVLTIQLGRGDVVEAHVRAMARDAGIDREVLAAIVSTVERKPLLVERFPDKELEA